MAGQSTPIFFSIDGGQIHEPMVYAHIGQCFTHLRGKVGSIRPIVIPRSFFLGIGQGPNHQGRSFLPSTEPTHSAFYLRPIYDLALLAMIFGGDRNDQSRLRPWNVDLVNRK